eukprot:jgi/Picre1/34014/NNA_001491.t1
MASPFGSNTTESAGRLRDIRSAVSKSQLLGFTSDVDTRGKIDSNPKVCEYIVGVLADKLGIKHAFGCPGDFAFAFDDAIEENPNIEFVVSSNELNASYAADAYARVHAKAERVGALFPSRREPGLRLQHTGRVLHHTLGEDAVSGQFAEITEHSCCVGLRVTDPASVPKDLDRVIEIALRKHQPVCIRVPKDIGYARIPEKALTHFKSIFSNGVPRNQIRLMCHPISVELELQNGVSSVIKRLEVSKRLVVMASYVIQRQGLEDKAIALIEKLGAPFVVTTMDKGVLSEHHPLYAGMYKGKMSHPTVVNLVDSADTVLDIGGILWDDLSTGFGTSAVLKERVIELDGNNAAISLGDETEQCMQNRARSFRTCYLGDVLDALLEASLPSFSTEIQAVSRWPPCQNPADPITYAHIAAVVQEFLQEEDIFVVKLVRVP